MNLLLWIDSFRSSSFHKRIFTWPLLCGGLIGKHTSSFPFLSSSEGSIQTTTTNWTCAEHQKQDSWFLSFDIDFVVGSIHSRNWKIQQCVLDQNYISTNEHVHRLHTNFLNKIRAQIESIILLFLLDIFPCGFYGTSLPRILGLLKLSSWVEPSLSRMDWLDVKSFPNLWCQEAEIFGAMRW